MFDGLCKRISVVETDIELVVVVVGAGADFERVYFAVAAAETNGIFIIAHLEQNSESEREKGGSGFAFSFA
jgi:hypothetical protein